MCVIVSCVGKDRPTDRQIEQMWKDSPHLGGVAWRAKVKEETHVFWRKGLNLEQMRQAIRTTPGPAIFHFRKQTVGGEDPALNHPFPMTRKVETILEGHTTGGVIFHNGTLTNWEDRVLKACENFKLQVPDGEWSDTRAIAFLMSIYGKNWLTLHPDQKGLYFSPTELIYFGHPPQIKDGWVKREDKADDPNTGFWVSQTRWETERVGFAQTCAFGACTNVAVRGGNRCQFHSGVAVGVTAPAVGSFATQTVNQPERKVFTSPFAKTVVHVAEAQRAAGLIGSKAFRRIKSLMETLEHNQGVLAKRAADTKVKELPPMSEAGTLLD